MKWLHSLISIIEKYCFGKGVYHREYCRKKGRCVECGRYICSGCNSCFNGVDYGFCIECVSKEKNYKNQVALPIKPLFKLKKWKEERYYESCNNRMSRYDY